MRVAPKPPPIELCEKKPQEVSSLEATAVGKDVQESGACGGAVGETGVGLGVEAPVPRVVVFRSAVGTLNEFCDQDPAEGI